MYGVWSHCCHPHSVGSPENWFSNVQVLPEGTRVLPSPQPRGTRTGGKQVAVSTTSTRVGREVQTGTDVPQPVITTKAPCTTFATDPAEVHHQCAGTELRYIILLKLQLSVRVCVHVCVSMQWEFTGSHLTLS